MFTPKGENAEVLVDIGLSWTEDPYEGECTEETAGDCKHTVAVKLLSVEKQPAKAAKITTDFVSAVAAMAVTSSVAVSTVFSTIPGSNAVGLVAQLQFSAILARLKGCPPQFKSFSQGFEWTLLNFPYPC